MYNWGLLAYEGVVGKVGSALTFLIRVPQAESIPFFWDGFLQRFGMGFFLQRFGMGFCSILLVNFIKALNLIPTVITGYSEVISLWVPAIVG